MTGAPRVEIEYCTGCRFLLRAAWLAQELLTTFEAELGEVALRPGKDGVFEVRAGEVLGTGSGRAAPLSSATDGLAGDLHLEGAVQVPPRGGQGAVVIEDLRPLLVDAV